VKDFGWVESKVQPLCLQQLRPRVHGCWSSVIRIMSTSASTCAGLYAQVRGCRARPGRRIWQSRRVNALRNHDEACGCEALKLSVHSVTLGGLWSDLLLSKIQCRCCRSFVDTASLQCQAACITCCCQAFTA
jgi:hypothetical protein